MGKECDPLGKMKARYANKKARLEVEKEKLVPELNCLQENILVPELNPCSPRSKSLSLNIE